MASDANGDDTPNKAPKEANLCPPWKPGESGNPAGRPKGARSKLSDAFFKALAEDFAQHGVQALEEMRVDKPQDYIRAIASLQTKEISGEGGEAIGLAIFKGLND